MLVEIITTLSQTKLPELPSEELLCGTLPSVDLRKQPQEDLHRGVQEGLEDEALQVLQAPGRVSFLQQLFL